MLYSLARLGMFKATNDAKSRFIHKHMREATALAQASLNCIGGSLPRHWGGPPEVPLAKVSQPLAVMATEAALEDYKRRHRERRVRTCILKSRIVNALQCVERRVCSEGGALNRVNFDGQRKHPYNRQGNQCDHFHDHQGQHRHQPQESYGQHRPFQHQKYRPPSTHAVVLPQGKGLVLIGEDGVRKSKFPRGCETTSQAVTGARAATAAPTTSRGRG
ncbi:unnamed protein product, partial [Hapterophycus canaliculatus]